MISANKLVGEVITILGKAGSERTHRVEATIDISTIEICLRTKIGVKWEGKCSLCEKYSQLWKNGKEHEARKLKPIERYYFKCLINGIEETVETGLIIAHIIGERTGRFRILSKMIEGRFPDYEKVIF